MEMYMSMASLILGLAQIPLFDLCCFGGPAGWAGGRDGAIGTCALLRRLAAVESSVTDMKEEQEQLRDRLEEAF